MDSKPLQKTQYDQEVDKYNSYGESFRSSRESFIKQVLILASSLLGILVSLHKTQSHSDNVRIAFSVVVVSLSIGILGLAVGLYSSVALHKKVQDYHRDNIYMLYNNPYYQIEQVPLGPSKYYQYFERMGYMSLLIALCSLSTYAILVA